MRTKSSAPPLHSSPKSSWPVLSLFIHVDFRSGLSSFTRTPRLTCDHSTFSPRHITAPIRTFSWHLCLCNKFVILKMFSLVNLSMHLPQQLCVSGVDTEAVLWGQPGWPFQIVPEVHLHHGILKLWLLRGDLQFWSMLGTSFQARPYVALATILGCQWGSFSA